MTRNPGADLVAFRKDPATEEIELEDRLHQTNWAQGEDQYSNWCREHCAGMWDVFKYRQQTVHACFEDPNDKLLFILRFGQPIHA